MKTQRLRLRLRVFGTLRARPKICRKIYQQIRSSNLQVPARGFAIEKVCSWKHLQSMDSGTLLATVWAWSAAGARVAAHALRRYFVLVFWGNSFFFPLRGIPCFFERFPFSSRDFGGSGGIKHPCSLVGFSLPSAHKKTGKGRTGKWPKQTKKSATRLCHLWQLKKSPRRYRIKTFRGATLLQSLPSRTSPFSPAPPDLIRT